MQTLYLFEDVNKNKYFHIDKKIKFISLLSSYLKDKQYIKLFFSKYRRIPFFLMHIYSNDYTYYGYINIIYCNTKQFICSLSYNPIEFIFEQNFIKQVNIKKKYILINI